MIKSVTVQFDDKHSKMIRELCGEYQSLVSFLSEIISKEYNNKKVKNHNE